MVLNLTDSHCHLDHEPLLPDQADVITRAHAAGVRTLINIVSGFGVEAARRALVTAERYPGVYAVIGIHPHDAATATPETLSDLRSLAPHPRLVAWGEIGLDHYYDFAPHGRQQEIFEAQLRIAAELSLPVTLHVRDAAEPVLATLSAEVQRRGTPLRGIWHCFSEGPEEAERAIALGLHISFSGVVTYKKTERVAAAAQQVPLERMLIETDSPFLAPIPHRGKRNEPALIVETARRIAQLRGIDVAELATATTGNAARLLGFDSGAER
jgi:TatD DNase family protein